MVMRKTKNKTANSGSIPLYHHKTDGGAEYLYDTFHVCPNKHKEGTINNKTRFVVRIDGDIEKDCELIRYPALPKKNSKLKILSARVESKVDEFEMRGIIAKAEIQLVEGSPIQTIHSGGLWGVESDCGAEYLSKVQEDQLAQLHDELTRIGFTTRQIKYAFKNAKRL